MEPFYTESGYGYIECRILRFEGDALTRNYARNDTTDDNVNTNAVMSHCRPATESGLCHICNLMSRQNVFCRLVCRSVCHASPFKEQQTIFSMALSGFRSLKCRVHGFIQTANAMKTHPVFID